MGEINEIIPPMLNRVEDMYRKMESLQHLLGIVVFNLTAEDFGEVDDSEKMLEQWLKNNPKIRRQIKKQVAHYRAVGSATYTPSDE